MKNKIAIALAPIAGAVVALAGGPVVERVDFSEDPSPPGWTANAGGLVSPAYSNYVTRIALSYSEATPQTSGLASVYAIDHSSGDESKIAELNTLTSAAEFDFPAGSDFRSFRIDTNGLALASFSATWISAVLDAPTNVVVVNNTGSSFDISWDVVENAVGYKISVWTNKLVGASAGTANWTEAFSVMGSSKTAPLSVERLAMADHGEAWRSTPFENGYLLDNGGGIRLGSSTAIGSIEIPHVVAAGENALRVTAARYSQNKGQTLAVLCVLDGGVTNLVGTLPVDCAGTYPGISGEADVLELPDSVVGGSLILQTVSGSDGKESRIAITGIEFVSGYSAGTLVRDVFREEMVGAEATSATVAELPPVAVNASVQAIAASEQDNSAASAAVVVDLANPPPVPVLAVSGLDVVSRGGGYCENFDALIGLGTSSEWVDGITLPYWQARKAGAAVANIGVKTVSTSSQNAGLYAYHGTNKDETASYSLAGVSKTNNKMAFGFAVTNDAEATLSGFSISYTARQWTFAKKVDGAQSLHFEYLVTNEVVDVSAPGDWTEASELAFAAFASFDTAEAAGKADPATGSACADFATTLVDVSLKAGEVLMLRWTSDTTADGDALGVDDVVLRCNPPQRGSYLVLVENRK